MDQEPGGAGSAEPRFEVRGALAADQGRGVLRYEFLLPSPPDDVWQTLTDPGRLAAWYGDVEGELRVGGRYHARLFPSGWEGDGRVLACEPAVRLRIESAEPGEAPVADELALEPADGGGTRLTLTRVRPTADVLAAYAVGTQLHLENLAAHLAGGDPIDPEPFWAALLPRYEAAAEAQGLGSAG